MRTIVLSGLILSGLVGCNVNMDKDDPMETEGGASHGGSRTTEMGGARDASGGMSGTNGAGTAGLASMGTGGNEGAAGSGGALVPSNIPKSAALEGNADLVLTGACEIDGKLGTIDCSDGERLEFAYELVKQTDPDGTNLGVFSVRTLMIEVGANVLIKGEYPVAIVASQTIGINGGLTATVDAIYSQHAMGGGFDGADNGVGLGPGGGDVARAADKVGAGGGAFCGAGGPGGGAAGPGDNGGRPYGNKTLTPVVGGSGGGGAEFGTGGGGGGAIQLVAGVSLNVGATGAIAAPGGGGGALGGGGGGSGGAILLEAPTVRVAGVVAANGGGGGTYDGVGQRGRADGRPAKGGSGVTLGGDGSSEMVADGGAGTRVDKNTVYGAAGGGGAGWIRINTADGTATITGTLSPSLETPCASLGRIGGS